MSRTPQLSLVRHQPRSSAPPQCPEVWSGGCLLLELLLGHHTFTEAWLQPCYAKRREPDFVARALRRTLPRLRTGALFEDGEEAVFVEAARCGRALASTRDVALEQLVCREILRLRPHERPAAATVAGSIARTSARGVHRPPTWLVRGPPADAPADDRAGGDAAARRSRSSSPPRAPSPAVTDDVCVFHLRNDTGEGDHRATHYDHCAMAMHYVGASRSVRGFLGVDSPADMIGLPAYPHPADRFAAGVALTSAMACLPSHREMLATRPAIYLPRMRVDGSTFWATGKILPRGRDKSIVVEVNLERHAPLEEAHIVAMNALLPPPEDDERYPEGGEEGPDAAGALTPAAFEALAEAILSTHLVWAAAAQPQPQRDHDGPRSSSAAEDAATTATATPVVLAHSSPATAAATGTLRGGGGSLSSLPGEVSGEAPLPSMRRPTRPSASASRASSATRPSPQGTNRTP